MIKYFFYVLSAALLFSCNKNEVGPQTIQEENSELDASTNKVWVLNEGLFNFGNASISILNEHGVLQENFAYQTVNNLPLGNILQSATVDDNQAYLVVNNSGKVILVDKKLEKINEITGFTSPRYWLNISEEKAFVTDLFANAIAIVNRVSNEITGEIPVEGWTEKIARFDNRIAIEQKGNNEKILLVDPISEMVGVEIDVAAGFVEMEVFQNELYWICKGAPSEEGGLYHLKEDDTPEKLISLEYHNEVIHLIAGDELFIWNNGLQEVDLVSNTLEIKFPNIPIPNNLYAAEFNPNTGHLWLCDAKNFVENGEVLVYNLIDENITRTEVRSIPNGFVFWEN